MAYMACDLHSHGPPLAGNATQLAKAKMTANLCPPGVAETLPTRSPRIKDLDRARGTVTVCSTPGAMLSAV